MSLKKAIKYIISIFKKVEIKTKLYNNLTINNYKYGFLLPIILNYFNIEVPENAAPLIHFSFSVFTITTVCLLCFLNVTGFLTAIILIQKYDIENKFKSYPKIIKIINYYKNTTLIFIIIEGLICLTGLLVMEIGALSILGVNLF